MKFAYFSPTPFNVFETIKAHNFAFKYFGGRPQMLVYDQDKIITIVVETAERRFKRNTFRNFQAKGLKATHDCNNVGL